LTWIVSALRSDRFHLTALHLLQENGLKATVMRGCEGLAENSSSDQPVESHQDHHEQQEAGPRLRRGRLGVCSGMPRR